MTVNVDSILAAVERNFFGQRCAGFHGTALVTGEAHGTPHRPWRVAGGLTTSMVGRKAIRREARNAPSSPYHSNSGTPYKSWDKYPTALFVSRLKSLGPSRVYRAERPAGVPTDCFCAAERGTVRRWLGKNVT
jgi:hypothetical protein